MSETSNQENKGDWSKREIGALWLRKSAAGNKYLSGHVSNSEEEGLEENREKIIVFANKDKKNDKAPDYRIYKSEPQQQKASPEVQQSKEEETEEELDVL
jgi:uncharacterized protein (DUF736 family)